MTPQLLLPPPAAAPTAGPSILDRILAPATARPAANDTGAACPVSLLVRRRDRLRRRGVR